MGDDTDGIFRLNIRMYGVIFHFRINGGYSELYVSSSWQRALTRTEVILGLKTRHTFAIVSGLALSKSVLNFYGIIPLDSCAADFGPLESTSGQYSSNSC